MIIHYQNTFEEFEEASHALAKARQKKQARKPIRLAIIFAIVYIYFFGGAQLWAYAQISSSAIWLNLVFPMAAAFVIGFVVHFCAVVSAGKWRRIRWSLLPSIAIFIGMIFVAGWDLSAAGQLHWVFLLPHCTWLLITVYFSILTVRSASKRIRKAWNSATQLHRAETAEITAYSVRITDTITQVEMRWPAFSRLQETPNLFLHVLGENQMVMSRMPFTLAFKIRHRL